ncbi:uncharacterized protein C3orf14 homolog isoform X1 [Carassius gibelio]|uniref:uncharacterized protein C3orf14 homolog isoform X1 n=1 Tax=Carassius gibelio TaxID=101364 RepID=UPI0022774428|nr:uncharacterized protein C3orf14 homolog isoform X1 [Carassius gibelio]
MASYTHEEFELSQKHEDILGERALLLQQMEAHYEQQKAKKKQQCLMSQAAKERNAQILEVSLMCALCYTYTDLQNAEKNLDSCFTQILLALRLIIGLQLNGNYQNGSSICLG